MADPISVFPVFVENQVFPPTGTGGTVFDGVNVTLQDENITVAVQDEGFTVVLEDALIADIT